MAATIVITAQPKLVARSDRIISFAGRLHRAACGNRSAGWLRELPWALAFFVAVGGLGGIRRRILSLDSLRRL